MARPSKEVEYRVMALAMFELMQLRQLIQKFKIGGVKLMKLICDNQVELVSLPIPFS